jgi:hypothetical protein
MGPFDQGNRQPERPAQVRLFPRHFTIITLVVKARQMQDSMQHEDLDFLHCRMSKSDSILQGNVGRDRDVTYEPGALAQLDAG